MTLGLAGYFGGGAFKSTAVDYALPARAAKTWVVKATAAGKYVQLPDATQLRAGVVFRILNEGVNDYGLRDDGGTALTPTTGAGAVQAGLTAHACLVDASTVAGVWRVRLTTTGAASASLPVRNLWVVGGNTTGTTPDGKATYKYDNVVWSAGTNCPQDHIEGSFLGLGSPDGARALLVGHRNAGGTFFAYADELDESGAWRTVPDAPYVVGRAQGAGLAGVGYLFGGEGLTTIAQYTRPAWSTLTSLLPDAFARGAAVPLGDKLLVVPGEPYGVHTPKLYWPAAEVWIDVHGPSEPRRQFAAWSSYGLAYVAGGYHPGAATPQLESVEAFDPIADTWAGRTSINLGRRYSCASVSGNACGYLAGGRDASDVERTECSRYVDDAWLVIGPTIPVAKAEAAGAVL